MKRRIDLKMKYYTGPADVLLHQYANGRPAISCLTPDGEPICVASINLPNAPCEPDHTYIKDYSENEGVLSSLILNQILISLRIVPCGFTFAHYCCLLPDAFMPLTKQETQNKMTTTHTVWIQDDENCRDIEVVVKRDSGERGERDQYGAPMTPDIEPSIKIISATTEDGEDVELTQVQKDYVISEAEEEFKACEEDYDEDDDEDDDEDFSDLDDVEDDES
jgi:hypothetical protein